MSLRKSPQLTPELLAAARRNARHSTGPRSPAAKQNSKLNALKHGLYAAPENERQTMLALGEDPEEFEYLKKELLLSYGPGEILWQKQIDDLARLYWRRERVQRAQEGLKRRALQGIDDWQHRRRQEMARVTFDASQHEMLDVTLSESTDRGVGLRRTLSYLELVREEIQQRSFRPRQYFVLESLYQGMVGWRQALIFGLLHRFSDPVDLAEQQEKNEQYRQYLRKQGRNCEPPGEPERQELLRLLAEEIASVGEEFEYAEKANEERAAIERDACLAPEGEAWSMLLRQEAALDRAIDRKVRILLRLRKDFTDLLEVPPSEDDGGGMEDIESGIESDIMSYGLQRMEAAENSKMKEQFSNVIENKGSAFSSPGRSGNVIENTGSYLHNSGISLKTQSVSGKAENLPDSTPRLASKPRFLPFAAMKMPVPKAPWSAVAAAPALGLRSIRRGRKIQRRKGGSCCYRTPRRCAHFNAKW